MHMKKSTNKSELKFDSSRLRWNIQRVIGFSLVPIRFVGGFLLLFSPEIQFMICLSMHFMNFNQRLRARRSLNMENDFDFHRGA